MYKPAAEPVTGAQRWAVYLYSKTRYNPSPHRLRYRGPYCGGGHRVASALYNLTSQLVLQVNTDDLVKRAFRGEPQSGCGACIEPLRPGGHDFFNRGVALAMDEAHCLIPGDSSQSSQLVPDCC